LLIWGKRKYDLTRLQNDIEELVRTWYLNTFGVSTSRRSNRAIAMPEAASVVSPDRSHTAEMHEADASREHRAASAAADRSPTFERRRQDRDQDNHEEAAPPPKRVKVDTSHSKHVKTRFQGQEPDEGIFQVTTGLVLKRLPWTQEEKTAVRDGFETYGRETKKWKKIKDGSPDVLRNRTTVQIKDCWRTMNPN
jgi:hypothetical protein